MSKTLQALINLLVVALLFALVPFGVAPMVYSVDGAHKAQRSDRVRMARRPGSGGGVALSSRRSWYAGQPMTAAANTKITAIGLALRTVFFEQLRAIADDPADNLLTLFNRQNSTRAAERTLGYSGFGTVPEYTGTLEYEGMDEQYLKTYTHKEYAKGIAIERQLIDDDEYGVMSRRAAQLGLAFDRTAYVHSASVFNNAFSASYLGGDSKALCATDHPNGGNALSNKGTTALSHAAVVSTAQAMMAFEDSNGDPLPVMPDTIVVPVALMETAQVIAASNQKPGTANNDANVMAGYRVVVSRYLTDANNWFLVDSQMARMYLNWFWRVRPEFAEAPDSDYSLVAKYRGYMRYSFGWDSPVWIYGHEVS